MDQGPATTSPTGRPRARSRGISFRSDKSGGSGRPIESPKEKEQLDSILRGSNKANPNAAINEAQPGAANLLENTTLQSLHEVQHKDAQGNVIVDPDRSNPTRPRLERPLDTIRNFERAIDDGYKRRNPNMRPEQHDPNNQYASRRSSYFGGEYATSQRRRSSANVLSGYDNGPSPNRPSPNGGGGYYGSQSYYGAPRQRYAGSRMQSDSQIYNQKPYGGHGYTQSHDTVNTGVTNGSDSTGPWANSTDPSSESSSIDKVSAMNKPGTPGPDGYSHYNSNGYNATIMEEHTAGMYGDYWLENGTGSTNGDYAIPEQRGYSQQNGYGPREVYSRNNSTPQLQQSQQPRKPIQLGGNSTSGETYSRAPANMPPESRPEPEKRSSWIKRRFSKKAT